jgi:Glycosyltransferase
VPEITPEAFATEVIALLEDSERRLRMGQSARASILARFDQDKLIDEIEALYETLSVDKK